MKSWIIVSTFFCLWISTMFSGSTQTYLAYALILTFGVLHGSNDISVIRISAKKNGLSFGFYRVLGYYILTVCSISLLFLCYPPAALILFIMLSGYHFGEQHLSSKSTNESLFSKLLYFFYGLTILFMIFYLNIDKVILILEEVTGYKIIDVFFGYGLLGAGFFLTTTLVYMSVTRKILVNLIEEFFYLLVLFVVFSTANLLWGFCIYFVIWHSLPSLKDQIKFLYGNSGKQHFIKYLRSSWVYWSVSVVGLCVLFAFFIDNRAHLISILIYFLAAITFPHVIVMSRLKHS